MCINMNATALKFVQRPPGWRSHECSRECRTRAFWALVDRSSNDNACWLWRGKIDVGAGQREPGHGYGYGNFCHAGEARAAHRESLIIDGRLKPRSKRLACHIVECPNKHCVNPRHLYPGTHADNARDAVLAGVSNLGKHIPIGPVAEALQDASGASEDWMVVRYIVPGVVLSECAGCAGFGFRASEEKVVPIVHDWDEGTRDYYVSPCPACEGTGLVRGSEITRVVAGADSDDRDPLDCLWDATCQLPSLFEEAR